MPSTERDMAEDEFALLRFDKAYREQHNIPDAYLPVHMPLAADLSPEALLRLLQEYAAISPAWQTFEPVWSRLVDKLGLAGPDGPVLDIRAAGWALRLGPVDLEAQIITLQRGGAPGCSHRTSEGRQPHRGCLPSA